MCKLCGMADYYDQCRFYAGPNHYLFPRHYAEYSPHNGPGIPPTVAAEPDEIRVDGGCPEGVTCDNTNQSYHGVVVTVESDDDVAPRLHSRN